MSATPVSAFGSPSAHKRPAPNVVFIVDTTPVRTNATEGCPNWEALETIIKLVDLQSVSTLQAKKDVTCHSQEFNLNTVEAFGVALARALSERHDDEDAAEKGTEKTSTTPIPTMKKMSMILRKALTDFRWNWTSASAVVPSPAKPIGKANPSHLPVKIRNYLFLISPFPRSSTDLKTYIGQQINDEESAHTPSPDDASAFSDAIKQELNQLLQVIQSELLNQGMFNGYLERRTALSWISPSIPLTTSTVNSTHAIETSFIEGVMSSILGAYGGSMIPAEILLRPPSFVSVASLFQLFRKKMVEPTIGRTLLCHKLRDGFRTMKKVLPHVRSMHGSRLWNGELVDDSQGDQLPKSSANCQITICNVLSAVNPSVGRAGLYGRKRSSLDGKRQLSLTGDPEPWFPCSNSCIEGIGRAPISSIRPHWAENQTFVCVPSADADFATHFMAFESLMESVRVTGTCIIVEVAMQRQPADNTLDPAQDASSSADNSPSSGNAPLCLDNPFQVSPPESPITETDLKRLGVIFPALSGCALLKLVDPSHEKALLSSCEEADAESEVRMVDPELLNQWFSNALDEETRAFLFDGGPSVNDRVKLSELTLNVWDAEIADERMRARIKDQQSIILSPKFTSPLPERITPRKYKTNILAFIEEDYDTMEDVGAAYKQAYLEALYGQQSKLVDLMEIALPRLYNAADAVTKSMGIAAASPYRADKGTAVQRKRSWSEFFIGYIHKNMLQSIAQIEQKYRSLSDILNKLDDETVSTAAGVTLDSAELEAVRNWKAQVVAFKVKNVAEEKRVLKHEIAMLKMAEAKMQSVLLLECLRLHSESNAPLPSLCDWFKRPELDLPPAPSNGKPKKRKLLPGAFDDFWSKPTKKRKGDKKSLPVDTGAKDNTENTDPNGTDDKKECEKDLFVRAIEELTDRLCIWHAVAGLEMDCDDSRLLKSFVEPIVVKYYDSYLPELVKSLYIKAGGDPSSQKPVPPSPFFKKKRTSERKRGSGMSGTRKSGSTHKSKNKDKLGRAVPRLDSASTDDANAKTRPPRKLPDFLKGLGKRQIVLGKAKKKEAKGTIGKSSKSNSVFSEPMRSSTSSASMRQSLTRENIPVIIKRSSKSSVPFGFGSDPLRAPRTKSMSAIDDNPFLDGGVKTSSTTSRPFAMFARSNTVAGTISETTSLQDAPGRLFEGEARSDGTPKKRRSGSMGGGGTPTKLTRRLPFKIPTTPTSTRSLPAGAFGEVLVGETPRNQRIGRSAAQDGPSVVSLFKDNEGNVAANQTVEPLTPSRKNAGMRRGSLLAASPLPRSPSVSSRLKMDIIQRSPSIPSFNSRLGLSGGSPRGIVTPRKQRISGFTPRKGTPSATPGSCKRLQKMLEGFAGFDWDELGDEMEDGGEAELVADTPMKNRSRG